MWILPKWPLHKQFTKLPLLEQALDHVVACQSAIALAALMHFGRLGVRKVGDGLESQAAPRSGPRRCYERVVSRRAKSARSIVVQPSMKVLAHERIIGKITMFPADALDLGSLTRAEPFVRIKAPDAFKQTLTAQDFVAASDAPLKAIRRVEKRAVAIGHAAVQGKKVVRGGPGRGHGLATLEYLNRGADPDRPMPQQPTAKTHDDALPARSAMNGVRRSSTIWSSLPV